VNPIKWTDGAPDFDPPAGCILLRTPGAERTRGRNVVDVDYKSPRGRAAAARPHPPPSLFFQLRRTSRRGDVCGGRTPAAEGPWLAGDSPQLRSRPPPARCRFRSPESVPLVGDTPSPGTLLGFSSNETGVSPLIRNVPAASRNPPHRPGSPFVGAADAGGGRSGSKAQTCRFIARRAMKRRPPPSLRSRSRRSRPECPVALISSQQRDIIKES
jgi:hypothetical protein